MRERLKRLTELRGREKVVDWLVILRVVVRCKGTMHDRRGYKVKGVRQASYKTEFSVGPDGAT